MLVAVVKLIGTQRGVHMMHQRDVARVVERRAFRDQAQLEQDALGIFMALLGQEDLTGFLVEGVVAGLGHALAGQRVGFAFLAHQLGNDLVDGQVHLGVVFGLTADDQRRARLVNQNRIDLIDDGVVQPVLHPVFDFIDHVVAQVVKAVLVVRAVGDVGVVGGLLFFARHVRQVDADAQAEEVVQAPHPARITAGQVVVDGDHMHALAAQRVQIDRQRGRQRLAFAGAHFGNFAVVQRHAAEHLHVEVTHLHHALAAFPNHRKRLGQQRVQRFALGNPVFELLGFGAQLLVVQLLERGFERIDLGDGFAVSLEQPVVAAAENLGQEVGSHKCEAAPAAPMSWQCGQNPLLSTELRCGRRQLVQLCANRLILAWPTDGWPIRPKRLRAARRTGFEPVRRAARAALARRNAQGAVSVMPLRLKMASNSPLSRSACSAFSSA